MSTPRDRIEARLGLTGLPLQTVRNAPPRVPDHELIRRIGQGAYGEVWLARNALGTWRAVKIVYRDNFKDARPYEREFAGIRRFEPLSRSNEGFVDVLQVGRDDSGGWFYYVMELADGVGASPGGTSSASPRLSADAESGTRLTRPSDDYTPRTLARDLHHRVRLPLEDCLQLGLTLSLALGHLHRHGLIHRDIKPSNIIFVGGVPKLADIGLVTEAAGANTFVGTEGFVPPEGPTSPQADLYALGKVLYEAAMGKDRNEFPEPFTQISTDRESVALMELNVILLHACAPDPKTRYASAEEMHADLALLHSGGSVKRRHQFDRQFQIAKQVGAVAIAATLLIGGAWLWQRAQTQNMTRLAAEKTTLANENTRLATEAQEKELFTRQNLYAADIGAAHHALGDNNLSLARALLQNHVPKLGQPDLRGFEWRYLWQQCQSEELFSLTLGTNRANHLTFSPNGHLLASGCDVGLTEIWDLNLRQKVGSLPANLSPAQSISSFSQSGELLATSTFQSVSVWNTRDFSLLKQFPGEDATPKFSADGKYLLTADLDRLTLRDVESWSAVGVIEWPEGWKHAWMVLGESWIAFAPDGNRAAVMCADAIRLLEIPSLREVGVIRQRLTAGASAKVLVKFSPDNKTLAILGTAGSGVRLWDTATQRDLGMLSGHSGHVLAASFSPDGRLLATGGADQTVKLWEVASENLIHTYKGQGDTVREIIFAPDGKTLISVGGNVPQIKEWNVLAMPKKDYFREPAYPVGFEPGGGLVAFAEEVRPLVLNPATLQITNQPALLLTEGRNVLTRVTAANYKPKSVQEQWYNPHFGNLSPDGRLVALRMAPEKLIQICDLSERRRVCSVPSEGHWVAFAPRRQLCATATTNATTTVWQLPDGEPKWVFKNRGHVFQNIVFSPDEDFVVTDEVTHLILWRIESENVKAVATFHPKRSVLTGFGYSPDGKLLATGEDDGSIRLWSMPSTEPAGALNGHTQSVFSFAFSPDGRTLASMCDDQTTRLWHITTRRELLRFHAPKEDQSYFSLRFSPDGRALATRRVDDEGAITWVWHAPSLAEIALRQSAD